MNNKPENEMRPFLRWFAYQLKQIQDNSKAAGLSAEKTEFRQGEVGICDKSEITENYMPYGGL